MGFCGFAPSNPDGGDNNDKVEEYSGPFRIVNEEEAQEVEEYHRTLTVILGITRGCCC